MMSSVVSMGFMASNDMQNTLTTITEMQADAQKQTWQRWKIMQDLQTKINEIIQSVTLHRAQTQDKLFDQWDKYVRGGGG